MARSVEFDKVNLRLVQDLDVTSVLKMIEKENLLEFKELIAEKQLDGRKLLNLTEGIIKLWRPKANARKFVDFIENLRLKPESYINRFENKYISSSKCNRRISFNGMETTKLTIQESIVVHKKGTINNVSKETEIELFCTSQKHEYMTNSSENIEKIMQYAELPKSFLYRNGKREIKRHKDPNKGKDKINSSYVPMDIGTSKIAKERKTSRLSDYIHFDLSKLNRFTAGLRNKETFDDRGYYALKKSSEGTEMSDKHDVICENVHFGKTDLNKTVDDHFYEDLNTFPESNDPKSKNSRINSTKKEMNPLSKSPCMLKINEIFSSFKFPIQPRTAVILSNMKENNEASIKDTTKQDNRLVTQEEHNQTKTGVKYKEANTDNYHIYENNDSSSALYDAIETEPIENKAKLKGRFKVSEVVVEDYLEPIQAQKDYADVMFKEKESLVNIVLKMFDNRFGFHKESDKTQEPTLNETESTKPNISHPIMIEPPSRPLVDLQKWNENLRAIYKPEVKINMADRPLPVPVENEFYYMEVDRLEASKLLEGHADGTFILRPSSQPFHAFTISLAYRGLVHNVGVRRRSDGRLALGFTKRSEQSFGSVEQLIEYHYRERLMLIVDGAKIGSTQLRRLHD